MAAYPQLGSGALSQFPVQKIRRARTVVNRAADGSTIKLADPAAEVTEWLLNYVDLSGEEAEALRTFFDAMEGTLNGFTFSTQDTKAYINADGRVLLRLANQDSSVGTIFFGKPTLSLQ